MKLLSVFWHSVEGGSNSANRADPTVPLFRDQVKFLTSNYTPVSTLEFLRIHQDKRLIYSYDKPPVLLGFDDGFKNVIRYALPVLDEFKVPAVFFVIGEILKNPNFVPWYIEVKQLVRRARRETVLYNNTYLDLSLQEDGVRLRRLFAASIRAAKSEADRQKLLIHLAELLGIDRPDGPDLDEDLRFVDREDLTSLTSSSRLTVASHAMTHRYLATLTYEEQASELEQSNRVLQEYCPSYYPVVAYPLGSFNQDTVNIASRIYKAGFATFLGSSYRNLYAYPRIGLGRNSVQELAYAVSPKRLNYILPLKRFLHATGIRRMGAVPLQRGRTDAFRV
jgi:peptidoglycan/xylan/chitin deacetylase (PgdA/CDA1 family)